MVTPFVRYQVPLWTVPTSAPAPTLLDAEVEPQPQWTEIPEQVSWWLKTHGFLPPQDQRALALRLYEQCENPEVRQVIASFIAQMRSQSVVQALQFALVDLWHTRRGLAIVGAACLLFLAYRGGATVFVRLFH